MVAVFSFVSLLLWNLATRQMQSELSALDAVHEHSCHCNTMLTKGICMNTAESQYSLHRRDFHTRAATLTMLAVINANAYVPFYPRMINNEYVHLASLYLIHHSHWVLPLMAFVGMIAVLAAIAYCAVWKPICGVLAEEKDKEHRLNNLIEIRGKPGTKTD